MLIFGRCPPGGKGYYEVEILVLDECPEFGFAMLGFERVRSYTSDGVDDDEHLWAVDGVREVKFHEGKVPYECTWKEGDVVGLACDLERGQVLVSVNGSFAPPNGLAFELPPAAVWRGLFAALSGKTDCGLKR